RPQTHDRVHLYSLRATPRRQRLFIYDWRNVRHHPDDRLDGDLLLRLGRGKFRLPHRERDFSARDPSSSDRFLLTSTRVRGSERIATKDVLDALGVAPDPVTRQRMAKRLPPRMQALGWHGPRALPISGPSPVQGYWRVPYALPARGAAPADDVGGPVE